MNTTLERKHDRMNGWRLLKLETHDAFTNMAIDEAILTARIANRAPNTVRFYRWKPSAVSIGKFQNLQNEVQTENCQKLGIDIVRRATGGGTVYHDSEDEITYSVIANKQDLNATDITEAYIKIYAGIAEALNILGCPADFNQGNQKNCPNLTVNGKKISGSAQSHKHGTVLQHGTLLLDTDLQKMFTLIRVPWAKTCMEVVSVAKNKITSINAETHRKITAQKAYKALTAGFEKALKTRLEPVELSDYETSLAQKLRNQKYATTEWNQQGKTRNI